MSRQTTISLTILSALLVVSLACPRTAATDTLIHSQLGAATIDGVVSPGEWGEWTDITGPLNYNPDLLSLPAAMSFSVSVRNTGYNLYLAIQVYDQLLANDTPTAVPPYHLNMLTVYISDGITRHVEEYSLYEVQYHVSVHSLDSVTHLATLYGGEFVAHDPSHPYNAVGFEATNGVRGIYTFEICFPLTSQPPIGGYGEAINLGLWPVSQYALHILSWLTIGDSFVYSYEFAATEENGYYIVPAFDPTPLVILAAEILLVVVVLAVLVILCRRRRRRNGSD